MKVLIDIDENLYTRLFDNGIEISNDDVSVMATAIRKGTVLENKITSTNLCNSCTNIGCEFQSGIVRTKCAFYMPPRIEPDNCAILDKIKAEIARLHYHPKLDFIKNDEVVDMALDIIDKYKAESGE